MTNTKWSGHISVSEIRAYFPNPEKFSSWTRFRRVLGWICRLVENCKRKAEYRVLSSLTATEIHNVEMIAVRKCQRDSFHLDIEALKGLGHAILGIFSTDRMVIELTKISK